MAALLAWVSLVKMILLSQISNVFIIPCVYPPTFVSQIKRHTVIDSFPCVQVTTGNCQSVWVEKTALTSSFSYQFQFFSFFVLKLYTVDWGELKYILLLKVILS